MTFIAGYFWGFFAHWAWCRWNHGKAIARYRAWALKRYPEVS